MALFALEMTHVPLVEPRSTRYQRPPSRQMRACCRDTSGSTSAMADVPVGKHPRTVPVSSQDSLWMGGRKAPSTKRMRPSWGRGLAVEDACRGDGLRAGGKVGEELVRQGEGLRMDNLARKEGLVVDALLKRLASVERGAVEQQARRATMGRSMHDSLHVAMRPGRRPPGSDLLLLLI